MTNLLYTIDVTAGLTIHMSANEFGRLIRLVNQDNISIDNGLDVHIKDPNTHMTTKSYANVIEAYREESKRFKAEGPNAIVFDNDMYEICARNGIPGDFIFDLCGELTVSRNGDRVFRVTTNGPHRYIELHWGHQGTPSDVDIRVRDCHFKLTEGCWGTIPHNITHLIVDNKSHVMETITISK